MKTAPNTLNPGERCPATPDLFSFANASPAIPRSVPSPRSRPMLPVASLPKGTLAWERILASLSAADLVLHVSVLWTGVVLEVAADPAFGRKLLYRDGKIVDVAPDSTRGRIVYLTVDRAKSLHAEIGLVPIGQPGSTSARFGFSYDGQKRLATLSILSELATSTRSSFL